MNERHVRVPAPRLPANLGNSHLSITDADGTVLLHFCPTNSVGAVFDIGDQRWTIYSPMTLHEFLAAVSRFGFTIAEGPAQQAWLDAVSAGAQQTPGAMN